MKTDLKALATLIRPVSVAFWLLAATDGHAKNFSIFLLPGGRYRMTPLYDVISVWPVVGNAANQVPWRAAKLAMATWVEIVPIKDADHHGAWQAAMPQYVDRILGALQGSAN